MGLRQSVCLTSAVSCCNNLHCTGSCSERLSGMREHSQSEWHHRAKVNKFLFHPDSHTQQGLTKTSYIKEEVSQEVSAKSWMMNEAQELQLHKNTAAWSCSLFSPSRTRVLKKHCSYSDLSSRADLVFCFSQKPLLFSSQLPTTSQCSH